jgi:PKD repeat protein
MKYNKFISKVFSYLAMALIAGTYTACTPEEMDGGLAPAPNSEMVKFSTAPTTANPNIVTFKNETPGTFKAIWDFGNGNTAEGNQVNGAFPVKGTYTVKLTVFTSGGYATNTKEVTIAETNVSMLDREDYNFLTNGAASATGKTWVIDRTKGGHMGVGPPDSDTPIWWQAGPNDKAAEGFYDDKMTFNLNGFKYTYQNNGDTFVNGANAEGLGGTKQGDDYTLSYTPPTNMVWSMVEENGKKYLVLSNKGFIAYYTGVSRYEILSLKENELYLKAGDNANPGVAWWLRLVPEGYKHPVEVRPYKMEDMFDNFDESGNITWKKETLTLNEEYDNPAPLGINKSKKVAMYIKQDGPEYMFANMFSDFSYDFNLNSRAVFKLKVFIPSYNDFKTEKGEDWAIKNLLRQVSVKLQNGNASQPWANQVEIKKSNLETDKWIELTFDFSQFAERKDLNRIVIQFGGEGNHIPGIFFLDDFRLEK